MRAGFFNENICEKHNWCNITNNVNKFILFILHYIVNVLISYLTSNLQLLSFQIKII